jgi:uncharacterized membrane protein
MGTEHIKLKYFCFATGALVLALFAVVAVMFWMLYNQRLEDTSVSIALVIGLTVLVLATLAAGVLIFYWSFLHFREAQAHAWNKEEMCKEFEKKCKEKQVSLQAQIDALKAAEQEKPNPSDAGEMAPPQNAPEAPKKEEPPNPRLE